MASNFQEVTTQNFSRGLVTVKPAHILDDGESPNATNIDFSRSIGRITKRRGHSLLYTALGGASPICGIGELVLANGATTVVAASDDTIYRLSGSGTWTSIFTTAGLNGANANFATYNNLLIIVSENITTQKWSGSGSSSNLGGTPPANVKFVKSHRNRVWMANTSAGNSRVHYSALDNPEDWTTSGDAGFVDVGKDDGEQITGLASVGPNLMVFKQNSTWVIKNGTPNTFQVVRVSAAVGCVASKSIVECEQFALFLSNNGVYAANPGGVALMSYNIQPDFDAMTNATKALAAGGRLRSQYWLAVDTDSNSLNDTVYVLDYVYGIWGKYTNKKESVFYTRQNGTLISGSSDTDVIRLHDDTENDNGSAITMTYDTPYYDFAQWTRKKQVHDVILKTNAVTGKTVVATFIIDGTTQGTTKTFNLDAVLSNNDQVIHKWQHPPDTYTGLNIQLRFTNSETSAAVQIFGYSINALIRERENG